MDLECGCENGNNCYCERPKTVNLSSSAAKPGCNAVSVEKPRYTALQRGMMSFAKVVSLLQDKAEANECDGECDEGGSIEPCDGCLAARALNEASDILREAL